MDEMPKAWVRRQEALPTPARRFASNVGYTLASLWIFGGAFFFYFRFTYIFYLDNKPAIDRLFTP